MPATRNIDLRQRAGGDVLGESAVGTRLSGSQRLGIGDGASQVGPLLAGKGPFALYGSALAIIGVVAAARLAATPIMGVQAPLLPFELAIFAVAYLCGLRPALLATFVAPIAATFMFSALLLARRYDCLEWPRRPFRGARLPHLMDDASPASCLPCPAERACRRQGRRGPTSARHQWSARSHCLLRRRSSLSLQQQRLRAMVRSPTSTSSLASM